MPAIFCDFESITGRAKFGKTHVWHQRDEALT